jgi:hypothetical protein
MIQNHEFDIKIWYDKVTHKLLSLEYLINHITYIHNDSAPYFDSCVKDSDFFYTSHRTAVKTLILDFVTLLNHKENYNLPILISNGIKYYDNIDWKDKPEITKLKSLKKDLNSILKLADFKKLEITRDKFYAHDDPDKNLFEINVSYEIIWDMIRRCEKIFNEFSYQLYGSTYYFKFIDKHNELDALHRFYQIQDYVFKEFKKSHDLGRLKKVYEIAYNVVLD